MKSFTEILAKKKNGETIDQLLAQCQAAFARADDTHAQFVQRANEANLYYTSQLPKDTLADGEGFKDGSMRDFVKPVLNIAINRAFLPQCLDTWVNDNSLAVAIRSRGFRKNPELEKLLEYNINKIFLRDQKGYEILQGLLRSAALVDGIGKVYVDRKTSHDTDTLEDWTEFSEYSFSLYDDWHVQPVKGFGVDKSGSYKGFEWKEETEQVQDPQTGAPVEQAVILIRGTIPLIKREAKPIVEEVEPHDIWFDTSYGSDFSKCRYACHRIKTTVGDAELAGYDPDKLEGASASNIEDAELPEMFFSSANYLNPMGGFSDRPNRSDSIDPKERAIDLFEHYIYSSLPHKKNETRLYQVVATGSEILEVNEIKRMPFFKSNYETVQGSFFSRTLYDIAKPFQDHLSLAYRIQEKKAMFATYPRYAAIKGQYDRQSLLNNRPGAVIEQAAQGSVELFPNHELSPSFVQVTQQLEESASEAVIQPVGFSNADGGVPQVATATAYLSIFAEAQKYSVPISNVAYSMIEPMYRLLLNTIIDEQDIKLFAPDGSIVQRGELPKEFDVIVDTDTTHDDFARNMQITNVAGMVAQLSQVPSQVITPQNLFNIAQDMFETSDIDSARYLTDPSQNQDPQEAHEQAEMKALQSEMAKVQLQTAVVQMRKVAAETYKLEQEAEETIRDGHANRLKDKADSMAKVQKIMSDAQTKAAETQVKAQEVEVKNKAVNYETILAAQKHVTDITTPRINGVR